MERMMPVHQEWTPDPELVAALRRHESEILASYREKPDYLEEHANLEESIRTGGYANRTLLELVQNAADAITGGGDDDLSRVEILLDAKRNVLYCANSGRRFSTAGLRALSMAHLSGKRGDEIGRFGLGFKSVLAVSHRPQIFSRSVSFEFNTPAVQAELRAIKDVPRLPALRTPVLADAHQVAAEDRHLAELMTWASTVVRLPEARNIPKIRSEIENFAAEFLLFVPDVRELRLRVIGGHPYEARFALQHTGDHRYVLGKHDGQVSEWLVDSRMHRPSYDARVDVGEAVARSEIKISVAMPLQHSSLKRGRFWSYFPLQDETSATALFNAPWSVNDDRTTLLRNRYNQEILHAVSEIFVDMLPHLSTPDDPAAHLPYMPARGREIQSLGDEHLVMYIPQIGAQQELIPNARGQLCGALELRPLDFTVKLERDEQQGWCNSPNTGDDVPHWSCYQNDTRVKRMRDLYVLGRDPDAGTRDTLKAAERLPRRRFLSWLREWAEGTDPVSSANALRMVARRRSHPQIETAAVIPTSGGMRSLQDKNLVFLRAAEDLVIEDGVFVNRTFLAQTGVEELLRKEGFRDLDPEAVLNARAAHLRADPSDENMAKLWDAVLDVPHPRAGRILRESTAPVKVPTLNGKWAWPSQVINLRTAPSEGAGVLLDPRRCVPSVAREIGVAESAVRNFAFDDELYFGRYREWVLNELAAVEGPSTRPITNVDFDRAEGAGPFSALVLLHDEWRASESTAARQELESWTSDMMRLDLSPLSCENLDSGDGYEIDSPAVWGIREFGLVRSSHGVVRCADTVGPQLGPYGGMLPVFQGSPDSAAALRLPAELGDVPETLLRAALLSDFFPSNIRDEILVEFVLTACRAAFPDEPPATIPARVSKVVEATPPENVFLAVDDEQQAYLLSRGRAFLRVEPSQVRDLVEATGCRTFEDNFAFTEILEGRTPSQPLCDVYTGLRQTVHARRLATATLSKAARIAKRVTMKEGGVEDQPLEWYLDGTDLIVLDTADDNRVLQHTGEAFSLGLDRAQIQEILSVGLSHKLEKLRAEAVGAADDAERLSLYIGDDDLRDALPSGLWSALRAQGLVDSRTSVAELFLVVYGRDSLKQLADRFREQGFPDVPKSWGGLPAAVDWVRRMGFGAEYAGERTKSRESEFVVPGAVHLHGLHSYQKQISEKLRTVLTQPSESGPAQKGMVELPTGAGKTRVATETVLRLFKDEVLRGHILWIAQSEELCEQAVQTFDRVWRHLDCERPLTIARLWGSNDVHEPGTDFSVIVATDAKIESVMRKQDYQWLRAPAAVFVDEAHRADSPRYTEILRWLGVDGKSWDRPLVGLSATPFKGRSGDSDATSRLAARFGRNRLAPFESDAYERLVELGVLARVNHTVLPGIDVELKPNEEAELRSSNLISANVYERLGKNEARMKILVEHVRQLHTEHPDWPVLVFTPSVLSAQVLAASLRYSGIEADSVSGQTSRAQRRKAIRRFTHGELQVLANCDLLIQGFDAPGVKALYIARPTFSPSAYIQMAGRGLRGPKNGGKEECLIVDMADNWGALNDSLGYTEYTELWKKQEG